MARSTARNIAFCCSANLDISLSAVNFMSRLNVSQPINAQHHERIHSLPELQESFGHYFNRGAAAEQSMVNFVSLYQNFSGFILFVVFHRAVQRTRPLGREFVCHI